MDRVVRHTGFMLSCCIALLAAVPETCAQANPEDGLSRLSGQTMGTSYSVVLAADEQTSRLESLKLQIDSELELVNRWMSTWDPDSEISRFNRLQGSEWFSVSVATAQVVREALEVSVASEGAFDVTVSPLVGLWGFGSSGKEPLTVAQFKSLRESGRLPVYGYDRLEVRLDPPALRKLDSDLEIDLSAIAKGYGVDRVADLLEEQGVTRYLVEIGGELRCRGLRSSRSPWRIGIESPVVGRRDLQLRIELSDQSLATSGDYRQFHEEDGRRLSHVIDPRTGQPVEHDLASVSVVTDRCSTADALATTMLVLGPEQGFELAEKNGIAACFIIRDGNEFHEVMTPSFASLVISEDVNSGSFWQIAVPAVLCFGLAIAGMAAGVIVSNRRLKGSCGGLAGLQDENGETACMLCQSPADACRELAKGQSVNAESNLEESRDCQPDSEVRS